MDELLKKLEENIKTNIPGFNVKFKDESTFMKVLGKIMFFNKDFMTKYITTIGTTVYFPTRKSYEENPVSTFFTLAHEYVHAWDYIQDKVGFILKFLFPQILAKFAIFTILAFFSPWFLLFLLPLLFLAPIPSPPRKNIEMRGYGMTLKVWKWYYKMDTEFMKELAAKLSVAFTSSAYYYMYPYKEKVIKELETWITVECPDELPYKEVYKIITTK